MAQEDRTTTQDRKPKEDRTPKLLTIGTVLLIAAWLCWISRDFVPSMLASRMVATGRVSAPDKRYIPRVERAFANALRDNAFEATLEPVPSEMRSRKWQLAVRTPTEEQAL